jgi:parallel beta-helix repeat protein
MFVLPKVGRFFERRPRPRRRWSTPLSFELLEDRTVPAAAATNIFTVKSLADTMDSGTLRNAIAQVNSDQSNATDIIKFDIPGQGTRTIVLGSPLTINRAVTIDGFTQTQAEGVTASGMLSIRLQGAPSVANGLIISATGSNSTIQGLEIVGFNSTTTSAGISIVGATNVSILGNDLGNTDNDVGSGTVPPHGGSPAPNYANSIGIYLGNGADDNFIGGTASGSGNVISGNSEAGIVLFDTTGNQILDNDIGTLSDGATALGNTGPGIRIDGSSLTTITGNIIAYNDGPSTYGSGGVVIGSGNSNTIESNSIHDNFGLGIELDGAANNSLPTPTITQVTFPSGGVTIGGTVQGPAGSTVDLQFFASAADPSGNSEGETLLGETSISIGSTGSKSFTYAFSGSLPPGEQLVTATATDSQGDISEFSNAYTTGLLAASAVYITDPKTPLDIEDPGLLGHDLDPGGQAVVYEVNGSTSLVGASVTGSNGGTFVMDSAGGFTFDPGTAFNHVRIDRSRTTSITYTIMDGGATASATLFVSVAPLDHAPTVTADATGPQANSVGQHIVPFSVVAAFDDVDVDAGIDTLRYSDLVAGPVDQQVHSLPAGLSINSRTGVIRGTVTAAASDTPYQVTITATDRAGATASEQFAWTILPTPPPTAVASISVPTTQSATISGNVLDPLYATGATGDTLSAVPLTFTDPVDGGVVTIQSDGSFLFKPGPGYDHLTSQQSLTFTVPYTIEDVDGQTASGKLVITDFGKDDEPTTFAPIVDPLVSHAGDNVSLNLSNVFNDVDSGAILSYMVSPTTPLPDGLSLNTASGVISGTIQADAAQSSPYQITITAYNSELPNLSVPLNFDWTIDGSLKTDPTDKLPIDVIGPSDASTLVAVVQMNGAPVPTSQQVNGSSGGAFILNAGPALEFDPSGSFSSLVIGQHPTTALNYVLDDGGATLTAMISVTVALTDHGPTIVGGGAPAQASVTLPDGTILPTGTMVSTNSIGLLNSVGDHLTTAASQTSYDTANAFQDIDVNAGLDSLTYVYTDASGSHTPPPGLSFNSLTGILSGTITGAPTSGLVTPPPPSFPDSATLDFTITATDNGNESAVQSYSWTILPTPPTAVASISVPTTQSATISGNVLDPSYATGATGDSLSAVPLTFTDPVDGGVVTIQSDGSFLFKPGPGYDHLTSQQSLTFTVPYTIEDVDGQTASGQLVITDFGLDDKPTIVAPIVDPLVSRAGDNVSLSLSNVFNDVDSGAILNYMVSPTTPLPDGLTLNTASGVISGTIQADAAQSSPYQIAITAYNTSSTNAAVSLPLNFEWTIDGSLTTDPTDSIPVDVIGPSDASTLVAVVQMNGAPVPTSQQVSGSNGGVFTLNAGPALEFDPSGSFSSLVIGQHPTTALNYVLDDGGATLTATVSVTVMQPDHPPTVKNQTPDQVSTVGQNGISLNVGDTGIGAPFDDLDIDQHGNSYDKLTFSASGIPTSSNLVLDTSTGIIAPTGGALAATAPGVYEITITATDNDNKSVSESFQWVILPASVTNTLTQLIPGLPLSSPMQPTASGNLLAGFQNVGLTVAGFVVNGSIVQTYTDTATGSVFTLVDHTGDYTFTPGPGYDDLYVAGSAFPSAMTSLAYQVGYEPGNKDGVGNTANTNSTVTATETLAITVTGLDDGPQAPSANQIVIQPTSHLNDTNISLSVAGVFTDIDEGVTLTYGASNLPPGLTINTSTGVITGHIDGTDLVQPYLVTITATDNAHELDPSDYDKDQQATSTFTWTIDKQASITVSQASFSPALLTTLFPQDVGVHGLEITVDSPTTEFGSVHYSHRLHEFVYRQNGLEVPVTPDDPDFPTDPSKPAGQPPTFGDTFTVTVTDPGGLSDTTTVKVTVDDVAPTGTFSVTGAGVSGATSPTPTTLQIDVTEASLFTVSLAGVTDPSVADQNEGFEYAFDVDGTWTALSTSSSLTNESFPDGLANTQNSTHTITERVFDELGGFTDYTATIVVTNVVPTAHITLMVPPPSPGTEVLIITGDDVSPTDSSIGLRFSIDFGDQVFLGDNTYAGSIDISDPFPVHLVDGVQIANPDMIPNGGIVYVPTALLNTNSDLQVTVRVFDKDGGGSIDYFITVPHNTPEVIAATQAAGNTAAFAQSSKANDQAIDKVFGAAHEVLTVDSILAQSDRGVLVTVTSEDPGESRSGGQTTQQTRQQQNARIITQFGVLVDVRLDRLTRSAEAYSGSSSTLQAGDDSVDLIVELLGPPDEARSPIRWASLNDDSAPPTDVAAGHDANNSTVRGQNDAADAGASGHWFTALIVAIVVLIGGVAWFFFLRRPIEVLFFRAASPPPPPSTNGSGHGTGNQNGDPGGADTGQKTIGYDPGTVPDSST